jgi:VWFA-related protein
MVFSGSRFGVVVIALAGGLGVAPMVAQEMASVVAQQAPGIQRQGDSTPVIKADVRLVTLDVIVTDDKGHTVQGLKQSDFKLLEDGTAQRLANFEAHSRPLQEEVREKLPANTFSDLGPGEESSSIVLMLDTLDSPDVKEQMYLRNQMIAYMKAVPEGTRIAIVQLDTSLHLLQGFTSDREELLEAVMSKRDSPKFSPVHDPCSEEVHPASILGLPPINAAAGVPNPCTADPASPLGQLANGYDANNAALRRAILPQAVAQLTSYLSGFPGRKNLIWFYSQAAPVESFSMAVRAMFADQTSFFDQIGRTTHVLTLNQIALTLVNTSIEWGVLPENSAMRTALRAQGGDFVANTNGLKEVIEHVADGAWNYYTLSYSPSNRDFDGAFRKLEVQLEERGLHLQYRRGYYAINDDAKLARYVKERQTVPIVPPAGAAGADGELIKTAMQMGSQPPRDVRFLAHVEPMEVSSGKAPLAKDNFLAEKYRKGDMREYQISYTVEAKSLQLTSGTGGSYRGRVDFICMVYDDEGNTVNSTVLRTSVNADERSYPALVKDGVEVTQTIAVPAKGNFFLRLGVHDVLADKAGALEVSVGEIKPGLLTAGSPAKP